MALAVRPLRLDVAAVVVVGHLRNAIPPEAATRRFIHWGHSKSLKELKEIPAERQLALGRKYVVLTCLSTAKRAGGWYHGSVFMRASARSRNDPATENPYIGFRVASIPEPGSIILLLSAALALAAYAHRRRPAA